MDHTPQISPLKTENSTSDIIDANLVSFFDLLARFDYEDTQRDRTGLGQVRENNCNQGTAE